MTTQTATTEEEQAQSQQPQSSEEEQPQSSEEEQPQLTEERLARLEAENRELKVLAAENNRLLNQIRDAFFVGTIPRTMLIHSIGVSGELLLRSPISVWVQQDDDGQVLADVPEFHVVGDGITQPDAVADAMAQLKELYEDLMSTPDTKLGALPMRWKRVLKNLVIDDGANL